MKKKARLLYRHASAWVWGLTLALLGACGSIAPAMGDLGTDRAADLSSGAEGGAALQCEDYCTCMLMSCPSVFDKVAACLVDCAKQTGMDRTCRVVHCGLAKMAADQGN